MGSELTESMRWIREHARELQNRYSDMYIAVHKGRVIAADRDLRNVYEKARPYGENVVIKYVFSGDLFVL